MHDASADSSWSMRRYRFLIVAMGLIVLAEGPLWSRAQDPNPPNPASEPAAAAQPAAGSAPAAKPAGPNMPSVWNLAVQGGIFMIPIAICSIVVLAFSLERFVGLRGRKIVPPKLLIALQKLNSDDTGIDPRQAYEVCQAHPSPLANVIKAAIMKVGRPHAELEKAVEDAVAREADVMAHNIRPINVSASVSPLIGLLGTVQGMIMAFMVTSSTSATGATKAQELAQGIYTALVTTFAGLCVAIPAVLLANSLEGRIERLLRDMEDIFLEVLPQFERFEGKFRVTRKSGSTGVLLKGTAPSVSKPAAATGKATISTPIKSAAPAAPSNEDETANIPAVAEPKSLWGVMGAREKAGKDS